MRRALLLAAALPACAAAPAPRPAPPVAEAHAPPLREATPGTPDADVRLEAPARAAGRVGAIQLVVRLANRGPRAVAVQPDPWLAEVAARGAAGPVRCAPGAARVPGARPVSLEPGASLALRIDVSARCEIAEPGEYEVVVSFPAVDAPTPRVSARVEVAPRTWVNPGPR